MEAETPPASKPDSRQRRAAPYRYRCRNRVQCTYPKVIPPMSIALPRTPAQRLSSEWSSSPAAECAACGSSMEAKPNPYFGTGLAIHRYVALCTGCHRVAFIPEPVVQDEPSRTEQLLSAVRGFFGRAA